MLRKRLSLFLHSFILGAILIAYQNAYSQVEPPYALVALFGDSITIGYNLEEGYTVDLGSGRTFDQLGGSAPTEELDQDLNGTKPSRPAVVVNWGDGGSGSAQGLDRLNSNLADSEGDYPSDNRFVMILYGTNDQSRGISSSATAANIRAMVNIANNRGTTPVVGTVLPRSDRTSSFIIDLNNQIKSSVGSAAQIVDLYSIFINAAGGYTSLMGLETSSSGVVRRLHPNRTGYQLIAQSWFSNILESAIEPEPEDFFQFLPAVYYLLLSDD